MGGKVEVKVEVNFDTIAGTRSKTTTSSCRTKDIFQKSGYLVSVCSMRIGKEITAGKCRNKFTFTVAAQCSCIVHTVVCGKFWHTAPIIEALISLQLRI